MDTRGKYVIHEKNLDTNKDVELGYYLSKKTARTAVKLHEMLNRSWHLDNRELYIMQMDQGLAVDEEDREDRYDE